MSLSDIKFEFPVFSSHPGGKSLVYLDNAATTQKPLRVINSIATYYYGHNANVHRGIYALSEDATSLYEKSRGIVKEFLNATYNEEIVFTSGTTDSLNMVAFGFVANRVDKNSGVLAMISEHHSNFVPYQQICTKLSAPWDTVSITNEGHIDFDDLESKLKSKKYKFFAFSHISNVLGIVNDAKKVVDICKKYNVLTILDLAQSIGHIKVDLKKINPDFAAFSVHKMYGPTGVGVLYVKKEHQKDFEPFRYGGGMISEVTKDSATFANFPAKLEAGTAHIAGVITTSNAIAFIKEFGFERIEGHEKSLTDYALDVLQSIPDISIIGEKSHTKRSGLISFYSEKLHAHDIASVLASNGVAVRAGHHCAMPLHKFLGIKSSVRASFAIYNSYQDIDVLGESLRSAFKILK